MIGNCRFYDFKGWVISELNHTTSLKQYLISTLDCVVPHHTAIYISIPITTGSDFLRWYNTKGKSLNPELYNPLHRQEVILPNAKKAKESILLLRRRHPGKIIIEPTSLEVPDWSQEQYLDFWATVIEKFINRIYFTPGWNYSRGCSFEFLKAAEKDIELMDINDKPISIFEGSSLIKKAVNEYEAAGLESEFLTNITAKLDSISSANEKPPLQR